MKSKTLLEKVIERRSKPSPNGNMPKEMVEEGEVIVEWVRGNVSTDEARDALRVKQGAQVHQKAGTILRNLVTGQYITITWNKPVTEEDGPTA